MSSPHTPRLRRPVPVLLISGVEEQAMLAASMSLQLGLPDAVAVRHTIDPERSALVRVVSDVTGVIDREEIDLAHACVSCAVREDIVPALERLGAEGRWGAIVACLPIAAEAAQVCRTLAWAPRQAPHVRVSAVIAALDGDSVAQDLLGDDLLADRGLATSDDDRRGVGEVACAMVEYADAISLCEGAHPDEEALLAALIRPGVPRVPDPSLLDAAQLAGGVHRHDAIEAWVDHVRRDPLPDVEGPAWRLDLRSERPFHPGRFYDELEILGGGPRRSRGCFWLPTRPDDVCAWECAGGQANVGTTGDWGREPRLTRLVVVGLDDDPQEVRQAFERILLTDDELAERGWFWEASLDGLEPWLGPTRHAA